MFETASIPEEKLRSLLPKGIKSVLGERVSLSGILWLINTHGGTSVFIPGNPSHSSTRFTGLSTADIHQLCEVAGGTSLEIPSGERIKKYLFAKRVEKMRGDGVSEREVAITLGISQRSVRRILNRLATNKQQA